MTRKILCRLALALVLLTAIVGGVAAQAIDTRCMESGGYALCTEPVAVASPPGAAVDGDMWTYNLCDMDASFPWREAAWCTARGDAATRFSSRALSVLRFNSNRSSPALAS